MKEIYECWMNGCLSSFSPQGIKKPFEAPGLTPIEAETHEQAAKLYAAIYHEAIPTFVEGVVRVRILCRKEHKDFKVIAVPRLTFNATLIKENQS
jgi:hypothetical protein